MSEKQHHQPNSAHQADEATSSKPPQQFGSNAERQQWLKVNGHTSQMVPNSPGMAGPVATAASGQVQIGNLTLDGSIGKVGFEGALGSYRDPRGDEHPSIGVNAGGSIMTTTATMGTPDNNARIGSGIGMGLGMNSTITDVDNDGIPERNIDFSLGPISLGWTTEDILSVISPERYQELQRQAEQAVAAEMGPSRFLNVWGAHQLHTQHMKRLVEAEVKRVNNKR